MIMQPCNREMQGINSLLNSSQISPHDLHNGSQNHRHQIQNSQMHHYHPELNHNSSHFDPTSHDDFFDQMLSTLPTSSWPELNPFNLTNSVHIDGSDMNPRDLSNEPIPSNAGNVVLQYDEHASLASKFRNHQISGNSPTTKSTVAAAAALMLQQQLLMSRTGGLGSAGVGDSGLLQMPLPLSGGDFEHSRNDVVDASSFKPSNPAGEGSVQALYNGFAGSLHGVGQSSSQTQHFHHPQGGAMQGQNMGGSGAAANQAPSNGTASGTPAQPKQRIRARRGQATDPHSIAERLRRERIAERMKALQELVPNANKTDKASMLDEIIDYVKFLQLQVKVLSMSRLGGAAAVAPLVADMSSEGGGDCIQATTANGGALTRNSNTNSSQTPSSSSNDTLTMTEHQVAKLMEKDMGSAMQYLQGKGLCLMPISLATAISTATCHSRNPLVNNNNHHPVIPSNGEGPSSPSMSVLTVQSATVANAAASDSSVKDAASVSKP